MTSTMLVLAVTEIYFNMELIFSDIEAVEKKIAALEGAEAALCFSSGMAAITSAIMHFVEKDCHVITVKSIYGPARNF